jgi:hypothetical protein
MVAPGAEATVVFTLVKDEGPDGLREFTAHAAL